jgi:hypothetical protein
LGRILGSVPQTEGLGHGKEFVRTGRVALLAFMLLALPSIAHAQSTFTGVVRDASGAMPGVTVEAASPVLIEEAEAL